MTALPPYTDQSILYYGNKYRGQKLGNIPASYFVFIYENNYTMDTRLKKYIEENMGAFKLELKNEKAQNQRDRRNRAR